MLLFNDKPIELRAYSVGELATIYHVDYRTLKKWLKPLSEKLGPKIGRFYSIAQVLIIFQHLHIPSKVMEEGFNDGNILYINPEKNSAFVVPHINPTIESKSPEN